MTSWSMEGNHNIFMIIMEQKVQTNVYEKDQGLG